MKQSIFIFGAIFLGGIFPQGYHFTNLIQYALMVMLFFAFLDIRFHWSIFKRSHLIIGVTSLFLPLFFYLMVLPFGPTLALTAFVCSIPPTAAAAPVLAQFLHTDVSYVTAAVILTNPLVAIFIPIVLPLMMPVNQIITFVDVLIPVFKVVGIPLIFAVVMKESSKIWTQRLLSYKSVAFYLFLFNIWVGCGNATHFITESRDLSLGFLAQVILLTTIIGILTFKIGEYLGPKDERIAGSLALGRKNTMFGFWLAITFMGPVVALGPIFHIVVQNIYNSYQIMIVEKQRQLISENKLA